MFDPTIVETAVVDGTAYIIVGSAGSNLLTVLEMDATAVTDQLLDNRDSRFTGITNMEVLTHHGQTYVIAGGADDGLTVFVLMPNGQLVARSTLADTTAMGLGNISTVTAIYDGNGITIFVALCSETVTTELYLDTGPHCAASTN